VVLEGRGGGGGGDPDWEHGSERVHVATLQKVGEEKVKKEEKFQSDCS